MVDPETDGGLMPIANTQIFFQLQNCLSAVKVALLISLVNISCEREEEGCSLLLHNKSENSSKHPRGCKSRALLLVGGLAPHRIHSNQSGM